MEDITSIFDSFLSGLDTKIHTLENRARNFEELRFTYHESYENVEFKEAFMVLNGIKLIRDLEKFKELDDSDEQWEFLFYGDSENIPKWNIEYIKEAFKEGLYEVNLNVKDMIKIFKSEVNLLYRTYSKDEFTIQLKNKSLSLHQKLTSLYLGLEFFEDNPKFCPYTVFDNRHDLLVTKNMVNTLHVVDGGHINNNEHTFNEFGYPVILIDRKDWSNYEFLRLAIKISEEIISAYQVPQGKLSGLSTFKKHSKPYKIFPSIDGEKRFIEILEFYGCFNEKGLLTKKFMPICDAIFTVLGQNNHYFRPLLTKGEYIGYLCENHLNRSITKLSSGEKYVMQVKNDFSKSI